MDWSANLAYAVGLITTDGNLSKDGRHIELTSKDIEQLNNFLKALNRTAPISQKISGFSIHKKYYRVQFSDVKLYRFLLSIGLTPNKTKSVTILDIPDQYFLDFLRGHLDGDGYTYSYRDLRWPNSIGFYTCFISVSRAHLEWIHHKIMDLYSIHGTIRPGKRVFVLEFAKKSSIQLLDRIYYSSEILCLSRKRLKIERASGIIAQQNSDDRVEDSSYRTVLYADVV